MPPLHLHTCHSSCSPAPDRLAACQLRFRRAHSLEQVPDTRYLLEFQRVALLLRRVSGPDTKGSNRSELNLGLCTFCLFPRGDWSSVAVGFVTAVQIVYLREDVSLLSRRFSF